MGRVEKKLIQSVAFEATPETLEKRMPMKEDVNQGTDLLEFEPRIERRMGAQEMGR